MLTPYREHVAERAAQGVVPKPLTAEQTAALVELLKAPPAGGTEFTVKNGIQLCRPTSPLCSETRQNCGQPPGLPGQPTRKKRQSRAEAIKKFYKIHGISHTNPVLPKIQTAGGLGSRRGRL
jgi:hypothetical protein